MNCKNCGKKVYAKEICSCGEKAPNVHGKGVALNSIICAVILVLAVFSLIFSISMRNIVNKNLIVKTIENINLCDIEVEDDSGKTIKLDQFVYDEFIDDSRITVENVDNILNDPFIKEFIIEKIEGYQKFLLDEGEMVYIRSEDIINLIDENSDLLYNEAGLNFLEPDKAELRESLWGLDAFSDFCRDYLTGWFTSGYVQTYFSFAFVIFLGVLMVVILVQWLVVYAVNGRRKLKALKKYSLFVIIPSALIFLLTLPTMFFSENGVVNTITKEIRNPVIVYSGIILAVGVILLVISILFGGKNKGTVAIVSEDSANVTENSVQELPPVENAETEKVPEPSDFSFMSKDVSFDSAYKAIFAPKNDEDVKETEPKPESGEMSKETEPKPEPDKASKEIESKPATVDTAAATEVPKKVFCTKCGHENRSNSSFCAKCGERLRK